MGETRPTRWAGGRIRYGRDGRATYQIREQRDGRAWAFALRARSEEEAEAELALFRRDPALYAREVERRKAEGGAAPVRLDDPTMLAFLEWTRDVKHRTPGYCHDLKVYLEWWQARIGKIDLRSKGLSLSRVKDALRGCTAERHRIAAIKAFLGWLRAEGEIETADDPTFGALKVPPARPAKRSDKGDVPREHVLAVIERLRSGLGNLPTYALMLHVQAGTGWHTTEVLRFMEGGKIEPLPRAQAATEDAAGVLVYTMRKGREHEEEERKVVSAEVLTAAKRLRLHGPFRHADGEDAGKPRDVRSVRDTYDQALARACKACKVPAFTGAMMRHTVATAAINAGADPAVVAAYLGHKDKRTTLRFYARHGVSPKPPGALF
jgi:integrase